MLTGDELENLEEIEALLYAQVYHESAAETQLELERTKDIESTLIGDTITDSSLSPVQHRGFRYFDESNKLVFYEDKNPGMKKGQENHLDSEINTIENLPSVSHQLLSKTTGTSVKSGQQVPYFIIDTIKRYYGISPEISKQLCDRSNWSSNFCQKFALFQEGLKSKHWICKNLRCEIRKFIQTRVKTPKLLRKAERIRSELMYKKVARENQQVVFLSSDSETENTSCNLSQSGCGMPKNSKKSSSSSDDEIIYIAPPPVPIVSVDTDSGSSDDENKEDEAKTGKTDIEIHVESEENDKSIEKTTCEKDKRMKSSALGETGIGTVPSSNAEETCSIHTEEDYFLNEAAHSSHINRFDFALHGSDFKNANDFVRPSRPPNPGECYETESSTSTSDFNRDYSNSVKTIVFNEVEFPRADIFTNNLEGFEELITPKKKQKNIKNKNNKIDQAMPSKKRVKVVRQNQVIATDSSSEESDYESTFNSLPNLSPMVKVISPIKDRKTTPKSMKKNSKRLSQEPVELLEESSSRKKKKEVGSVVAVTDNNIDLPNTRKAKKKKKLSSKSNEENEENPNKSINHILDKEIGEEEIERGIEEEAHQSKKKKKKKKKREISRQDLETSELVQDNDAATDKYDNENIAINDTAASNEKIIDEDIIFIDNMPAPIEIADSDQEEIVVDVDLQLANTSIDNSADSQLPDAGNKYSNQQQAKIPDRDFSEFDIQSLQAKMSDNPSLWKISVHDRIQHKITKRGPRCHKCRQFGHMAVKCPNKSSQPNCQLCGEEGHGEPRCPNKICFTCGNQGSFSTVYCWRCSKTRTQECTICKCTGHSAKYCPDLWRRYHLTTKPGAIIKPSGGAQLKPKSERWCAGCASRGHLDYECNSFKYIREYPAVIPWVKDYSCVYNESQETAVAIQESECNSNEMTRKIDMNNTINEKSDTGNINNENVLTTQRTSEKNSPTKTQKPQENKQEPTNLNEKKKIDHAESFQPRGNRYNSNKSFVPQQNHSNMFNSDSKISHTQQIPQPFLNIFTPAPNNIVANQINNFFNPAQSLLYQNNSLLLNPVSYTCNQSNFDISYTHNQGLFAINPREMYSFPQRNFYQDQQYFSSDVLPFNLFQRFEPPPNNNFSQPRYEPLTKSNDIDQNLQPRNSTPKNKDKIVNKFEANGEKLAVKFRDIPLNDLHEFLKEELEKLKSMSKSPKFYKKKCHIIDSLNKKNHQKGIAKQTEFLYKSLNMFFFGVRKLREGNKNYNYLKSFVHQPGSFAKPAKRKQLYNAYKYIFGGRHPDVNYKTLVNIYSTSDCKFE